MVDFPGSILSGATLSWMSELANQWLPLAIADVDFSRVDEFVWDIVNDREIQKSDLTE